jgi:hypothetical protein
MTMIDTALKLVGATSRAPLKLDAAAAIHPLHYYVVIPEDGKLAEAFPAPCGCDRVGELLRTYGLPRNSAVFDIGSVICIDDTLH